MSQRTSHVDVRVMSCANCSQTIADTVVSLDGVVIGPGVTSSSVRE